MLFTTRTLALSFILLACSISAGAAPNPTIKADAQAIDSACKAEAATAGCGDEVVGKGLLKCMGQYKKAHKDFRFSDGCRSAIKQLREDRMAMKK